ncbi:unnamed protein product [Trichobilharzia regenti]|nr:unnamed protein product [Trichobilharzia regenti]
MRTNINEDIIQRLAHVLAEGKVFTTVSELIDSQRIEEQILHKQLVDLRAEQSGELFVICHLLLLPIF